MGYTRQDTADNIANEKVANADDLDAEFDAIEAAFSSAGHNHDGTEGEGGDISLAVKKSAYILNLMVN